VAFAVEDNGIGIPARELKRIFRRFYQVDRRRSRATGGVGLGLSIASVIVRAHRGSVQVASRVGEGSTFTVTLPASTAA
jgi:signal transduction histidine kinase